MSAFIFYILLLTAYVVTFRRFIFLDNRKHRSIERYKKDVVYC